MSSKEILGSCEVKTKFAKCSPVFHPKYGHQLMPVFNIINRAKFGIHRHLALPERLPSVSESGKILEQLIDVDEYNRSRSSTSKLAKIINTKNKNLMFLVGVRPSSCGRWNEIAWIELMS